MRHCVFGSVARVILSMVKDDENYGQTYLIADIFTSYYDMEPDFSFDSGLISRWINGLAPVSPKIKAFYLDDKNQRKLTEDFRKHVLPKVVDPDILVRDIYELLMEDPDISENKKNELSIGYPYENDDDKYGFIGRILKYTLEKKAYSPDYSVVKASGSVHDRILGAEVPQPCRHFSGREKESEELHELLKKESKVFVTGIPGIGKSEFIKAYAKKYRKEYRDILYFSYTGDLKSMITGAMFADDTDCEYEVLFRKHHKYFHNLGREVLLIIDNFNVTEQSDKFFPVLMNYTCSIVFTTRSVFECGASYTLSEIEDKDTLFTLASKLYSNINRNQQCFMEIIAAVHHHTLAVELSARLLEKGLITPAELLKKLRENSADPDSADKVSMRKDGMSSKATYYEHLSRLCALSLLDDDMKNVIRNMVFIPECGIRTRRLAKWCGMSDMNAMNDLIELGLIRNTTLDIIALHSIIRDLAVKELEAAYTVCSCFIETIHRFCLNIGQYRQDHRLITGTVLNIMKYAVKDDIPSYILFLEDALGFMESYSEEYGMYYALGELHDILNDKEAGTAKDRALMYNYEARCKSVFENNDDKAIEIHKKALKLIPQITDPVAVANLYMNMGVLYHDKDSNIKALEYMEQGIAVLEENNIVTADYIAMKRNYATVLASCGENLRAHTILMDAAHIAVAADSSELAGLLYDAASINVRMHFYEEAVHLYKEAFDEYAKYLDEDQLNMRKQAALYLLKINGCNMIPGDSTYLQ